MKTILISESDIGFHSETKNDDCLIIPFVFIPTAKYTNSNYIACINCKNLQINDEIIKYKQEGDRVFFLGYDLDENGEYMAQAMRNFLIQEGVSKEDIYRTPLTENGYIAMSTFLDISEYIKFRYFQDLFMKQLNKAEKIKISILDFLSIKYLNEKKGKDISLDKAEDRIDLTKTSTVTFVVNNLLKENNV